MNPDRVKAAADQAAESAVQVGPSMVVGHGEWHDLLDAIYDDDDGEEES